MTAFTTPSTWSAATLTAAQLNAQLRDNTKNVDERLALHGILSSTRLNQAKGALVGVRCTGTGTQTISNATDTSITWGTEAWDSDGFHSTSSNTNRITIPSGLDGIYLVSVSVLWVEWPFVNFSSLWVEDDAGIIEARRIVGINLNEINPTLTFVSRPLVAGDWLTARVRQEEGASATIDRTGGGVGFTAIRLFAS